MRRGQKEKLIHEILRGLTGGQTEKKKNETRNTIVLIHVLCAAGIDRGTNCKNKETRNTIAQIHVLCATRIDRGTNRMSQIHVEDVHDCGNVRCACSR